ncbi:putative DNA-binding protein (UPF0251 family) [Clostridium sp. KNHs216]|nr:putative DNA-binding protein (UPF0251 family) [Clostridium sp. KNHs216]
MLSGKLGNLPERELIVLARPTKWRKIENIPAIPYFVPSETEAAEVPENILKLEELEAVRLKDLEGLEQGECAERMEVSRPTFQRILLSAREKIADSLINGKTIHVEGGTFTRNICPVKCRSCGKEWTESFESLAPIGNGDYACPSCGSKEVSCGKNCKGKFCRRNCCWFGGNNE